MIADTWRCARVLAPMLAALAIASCDGMLSPQDATDEAGLTGRTLLLGTSRRAAAADSAPAGEAEAFKMTAAATGTLAFLNLYVGEAPPSRVIVGVYADSSGSPGALLANGKCTLTRLTANAWNRCSLTNGPAITAGQVYWFALLAPRGTARLNVRDDGNGAAGTNSFASSVANLTTLPATYAKGRGWATAGLSAYGSTAVAGDAAVAGGAAVRLFSAGSIPAVASTPDPQAVTVGMKFRADVAGEVTGILFYKGSGNTGTHHGHLWTSSGAYLGGGAFSGETASGWQTLTLATPVAIAANTVYVVSYYAPRGYYSSSSNYFASAGVDAPPLHALKDGVNGGNGVYAYGAGAQGTGSFPSATYYAANYWVDVLFQPSSGTADTVDTTAPTAPDGGAPDTGAPVQSDGGCVASCAGKMCGPNGCGGSCGSCGNGQSCNASGQCVTTTEPALRGWQLTSSNIGLAAVGLSCGALPAYSGPLKPAQGARISNVRIAGPLDLSNGDIIVEKSCIRPTSVGYHNNFLVTTTVCAAGCSATVVGKVIIRDSEIDGSAMSASTIAGSCAFLGVGTLQRNYMHGMGSGICFFETGTEHNALAEQNYVTGLRSYGSSHNEAATVRDFRKNATNTRTVKFINNRLDCQSGNETGGLFIQPTWVDIYNLTVQGNYLEGGGYNLYAQDSGGTYGNIQAIDNRFRPTGWGPSATPSGPGWAVWKDNYLYDPSKPDAKGAVVNP